MVETHAALLALRLMTALQRQRLSVAQLAKRANVPLAAVQRLCNGTAKQPSVWTVLALANALGVSMDALLKETP